ncbi:carotenoid biosynthesis protein [Actinoplanes sp. L3-i22]|uniref:carotenoid biosynthesis protein n=1 Tax=Actinoplanes sp. L3-i22 TaxID=2836373 RepID=UPI001C758B93|nr:carotenoid biosynthesis protein [Actinoplanes sp. L3-i22]BCY06593.1 membrane protein [Actinoplanes sp. L3-i22]
MPTRRPSVPTRRPFLPTPRPFLLTRGLTPTRRLTDPAQRSTGPASPLTAAARWLPWGLLGVLVLAQICYPLTEGDTRAHLTVATVLLGVAFSLTHALLARGPRAVGALLLTATLGGFAVEAIGVATGFPFGTYEYSGRLGPRLLDVPLIIPLAWTWMAWPAWLAALRVARGRLARIALAGAGLATWDLFLDPQMVAEHYWRWADPVPALPGVPGVPIGNYLGWLGFALLLMAALSTAAGQAATLPAPSDAPALALWLWTYASSVLAHAVFLSLPASAAWGALLMGTAVLPLIPRLRTPPPVGR